MKYTLIVSCSITVYKVLAVYKNPFRQAAGFEKLSLVWVRCLTGKTHEIRAHMQASTRCVDVAYWTNG